LFFYIFPYGELAYDDGNPNLTLQFNVSAGNVFATKFTPPIIPSQVLSVIYYVPELTGSDYFILEIYDELIWNRSV